MTTAIKAQLSAHPDHVVACLDFKNAFGTIDRTTCIQVLRELCPHHPAWLDAVNVLLSEPALVVNPERNHLAMTYDGLPPGGPVKHISVLVVYDRGTAQGGQEDHLRGDHSVIYR